MTLRFGDYELEELFELRQAGRTVALEPKPFDVLRIVAKHSNPLQSDARIARRGLTRDHGRDAERSGTAQGIRRPARSR